MDLIVIGPLLLRHGSVRTPPNGAPRPRAYEAAARCSIGNPPEDAVEKAGTPPRAAVAPVNAATIANGVLADTGDCSDGSPRRAIAAGRRGPVRVGNGERIPSPPPALSI